MLKWKQSALCNGCKVDRLLKVKSRFNFNLLETEVSKVFCRAATALRLRHSFIFEWQNDYIGVYRGVREYSEWVAGKSAIYSMLSNENVALCVSVSGCVCVSVCNDGNSTIILLHKRTHSGRRIRVSLARASGEGCKLSIKTYQIKRKELSTNNTST